MLSSAERSGSEVEFDTLVEMFDRLAEKFARDVRPALMYKLDGEYRSISYPELKAMVDYFASGLSAIGSPTVPGRASAMA